MNNSEENPDLARAWLDAVNSGPSEEYGRGLHFIAQHPAMALRSLTLAEQGDRSGLPPSSDINKLAAYGTIAIHFALAPEGSPRELESIVLEGDLGLSSPRIRGMLRARLMGQLDVLRNIPTFQEYSTHDRYDLTEEIFCWTRALHLAKANHAQRDAIFDQIGRAAAGAICWEVLTPPDGLKSTLVSPPTQATNIISEIIAGSGFLRETRHHFAGIRDVVSQFRHK